jgi:dTDP-4-amino-4,6-dideoxygalactose transaminase
MRPSVDRDVTTGSRLARSSVDDGQSRSMTVPALPFLPFALPEIGDAEIAEVVDTLKSGWVTTGPKAKRFEAAFTEFLGDASLESIAVNSATAGLHLALEALGIGPGDEVITTTHTFTATAEVVRYLGADVVLVDIDPATLNIDPKAIEAAITPRTKCILPVHYAGLAADMPAILDIARRHGLKVVEDAAHALPTLCADALVGTLQSDITVFSFYANKTMTTGEGGMIVTRHPELAKRMKVMRLHGMSRDAFDRFTATVPSWYYEIVAPGFKYNLTDIAASLGLQQLKRIDAFQVRRIELAALLNAGLAGLPLILPPMPTAGNTHSWHLYVVRLTDDAKVSRDVFIERLFASGIGVSVHYIPLHLQPYWRDRYALRPEQFPHSQRAFERMVTLPLYTRMTDADAARVCDAVHAALAA